MNFITLLMCCLAAQSAYAQYFEVCDDSFNPVQYLGQWYQAHATAIVYATIEPNATCVTATYSLYDANTLVVYNSQNNYYPGGEQYTITGYAKTTDDPCQLLVSFPSEDNQTAQYWILELGPVENDVYQYSVISEATNTFLFILARDLATFQENWETDVLDRAVNYWGFNGTINAIIETEHTEDCIYPEQPDDFL